MPAANPVNGQYNAIMTNEELVLKAVRAIIDRRRAAHRFPECALRREIVREVEGKIAYHDLTRILMHLVNTNKLDFRPTKDEKSYYLK